MLMSRMAVGGAEKMALTLTAALTKRRCDVVVAGIYRGDGMRREFDEHALAVHAPLACCRFDFRGIWRVRKLIRRYGIDVVLIVDAVRNAAVCGLWGARLSGRPVARLLWCHSAPRPSAAGPLPLLRKLVPHLDAVIAVARWQRDALAAGGLPPSKLAVIENGIDLSPLPADAEVRRELGIPQAATLLLQVANYWPLKDPTWLLEAFAAARQSRPDLHLLLVGRDMDAPAVRHTVAQLHLTDAVTLTGTRTDVRRLLQAADIFVVSSLHETLSLAALEAMAAALPMIVTDIPAFADILEDNLHCLKCPPLDTPALTERILRLAGDTVLAQRLARTAHRRVDHYSADRMADRFVRLLRAAAASTAPTAQTAASKPHLAREPPPPNGRHSNG